MVGMSNSKKIVGFKQTIKAIKNGTAVIVYVSKDADNKIVDPIVEASKECGLEVIYFETMNELGRFCEIDVGAAAACMLK